eukprot:256729-Pleurochrysis_carterae.AAC.1
MLRGSTEIAVPGVAPSRPRGARRAVSSAPPPEVRRAASCSSPRPSKPRARLRRADSQGRVKPTGGAPAALACVLASAPFPVGEHARR